MAYTNAVFYLDYVNGNDAARATLSDVVFSNPSEDVVLGTYVGHGLITGAVITISGCTQAYANSAWKITRLNDDTFTLDGASWASFTGADVTGNVVPFGGQSWADAWKTLTTGATAARIAPGDEIRIAKSPAPTSLGQSARWAGPPAGTRGNSMPATVAITSSTNTTPIVVTKNGHGLADGMVIKIINHSTNTNANGIWVVANATENTFELEGSVGNGVGSGGTFQNVSSRCVVLTTPVTETICNCESNWTAGTNVTSANVDSSYYKQFIKSVRVICNSSHNAAGIIGKFGLPAPLDLSGYQQVSFWLYHGYALEAAGDLKLKLYSDAACTSEVESFDIPALIATNTWVPITIDKGSNMAAAVQGVALYAGKGLPSRQINIDNIIACKNKTSGDSLSLQSLISKNTMEQGSDSVIGYANEPWWAIQSIDGKIIVLETNGNYTPFGTHPGYVGTPGVVPLYKRETIKTDMKTSGNTQEIMDSGTDGSPIYFKGGYNTSGTDTCDGETLFDALNGKTYGLVCTNKNYINVSKISMFRYSIGFYVTSGLGIVFDIPDTSHHTSVGILFAGSSLVLRNVVQTASNGASLSTNLSGAMTAVIGNALCNMSTGTNLAVASECTCSVVKASGNLNAGVLLLGSYGTVVSSIGEANYNSNAGLEFDYGLGIVLEILDASYNQNYGIYYNGWGHRVLSAPSLTYNNYGVFCTNTTCTNNIIHNAITANNVTNGVYFNYNCTGPLFANNITIGEANKVGCAGSGGNAMFGKLCASCYGGDPDDHRIYNYYGTLLSQKTVRHTESGIAWQIEPSSATAIIYPFTVSLAKIACEASKLVTVSMYMRRSDTKLTLGMLCKGGQLTGVPSDILTLMTAAADTWEKVSFTFTPTQKGVIEIEVYTYRNTAGGTYLGYYDDLEITQAE